MGTTSTTITVNTEAYTLLKKLKQPGDSFSDVILEHVHVPAETCGELLVRLESKPAPDITGKKLTAFRLGRGRKSSRQ